MIFIPEKTKLILIVLISLGIGSCEKKVDTKQKANQLFQASLQSKIKVYKNQKLKTCLSSVLSDAEIHVDSLIKAELKSYSVQNDSIPKKPIRPPYVKEDSLQLESTPIKPIWDTPSL